MSTMLKRDILLQVTSQMRDIVGRQRDRAAKHPVADRELLVGLRVPDWLFRILGELEDRPEEPMFYGVPVVLNANDEVEAVWWDLTMPLDHGVPFL